jgi:hypothetical protein
MSSRHRLPYLPLLPSGPDGVRRRLSREVHFVSKGVRRNAGAIPSSRTFNPAWADLGYRAPLAPRLARPRPTGDLLNVHPILEFLTDFEERKLLGSDINDLAGLGISALIALVVLDFEAAETSDFHPLPSDECIFHVSENCVHHFFSLFERKIFGLGNSLDELRFVHTSSFSNKKVIKILFNFPAVKAAALRWHIGGENTESDALSQALIWIQAIGSRTGYGTSANYGKNPECPARPSSVAWLLRRVEKSEDEWSWGF